MTLNHINSYQTSACYAPHRLFFLRSFQYSFQHKSTYYKKSSEYITQSCDYNSLKPHAIQTRYNLWSCMDDQKRVRESACLLREVRIQELATVLRINQTLNSPDGGVERSSSMTNQLLVVGTLGDYGSCHVMELLSLLHGSPDFILQSVHRNLHGRRFRAIRHDVQKIESLIRRTASRCDVDSREERHPRRYGATYKWELQWRREKECRLMLRCESRWQAELQKEEWRWITESLTVFSEKIFSL